MARSFGNDNLNRLFRSNSFFGAGANVSVEFRPVSLSVWLRYNNTGSLRESIFNNNNTNTGDSTFYVDVAPSTGVMRLYSIDYANSAAITVNTNWHQYGWTWDTNDSVSFYQDGALISSTTRTRETNTAHYDNGANIGCLDANNAGFDVDGELAEFGLWSVILTAGEMRSLARFSPLSVRQVALASYLPLRRENIDLAGGETWATVNTVGVAAHPGGIIYPANPTVGFPAPSVSVRRPVQMLLCGF